MPDDRRYRDPIETRDREYLGDAVYAGIDTIDRLVLTTEDGIGVTNRIIFEPEVVAALYRWLKQRIEPHTLTRGERT